jgi:hypothetical protein
LVETNDSLKKRVSATQRRALWELAGVSVALKAAVALEKRLEIMGVRTTGTAKPKK